MSGRAVVELEELREEAARSVAETSLRYTAREIGITPTSLTHLIHQRARPYGVTVARLRAWHLRQMRERDPDRLVATLLPEQPRIRTSATRRIRIILEDAWTKAKEIPPWGRRT